MNQVNQSNQSNQSNDNIQALNTGTVISDDNLREHTVDGITYELDTKEQYFRQVTLPNGEKVKRDNVNYLVPIIKGSKNLNLLNDDETELMASELFSLVAAYPKQVAAIVNRSLDEQAKALFVDNKDDWNYTPNLDEISIKSIGDKLLEPVRRGRVITKVTLEALAEWYVDYSVEVLGKTHKAASNGSMIIKDNFSSFLGNLDVLNMFIEMFNDVDLNDANVISSDNAITLNAVINQLEEVVKVNSKKEISIDDL